MSYIEGTVMDIVYRNEENSYTVLELDSEGNPVICVGNIPLIQPGEYVRFYGGYTQHKNYGRQFKVISMESKMPESDESIRLFLSGGLIKGVGEIIAYRVVEEFHEGTFAVIENEPEKLEDVRGISPKLAQKIHEQFVGIQNVRGVIMQLQKMGLGVKEAMAAYEAYGSGAPFLIEKNPYRLMDDVRGIGFLKADTIAAGLGIENYQEMRRESVVRYILRRKMEAGHTCLPETYLVEQAAGFLQEERESVMDALINLIKKGTVAENVYNSVHAVADTFAYLAESSIAQRLLQLLHATPKIKVAEGLTEEILAAEDMLSPEQLEAVRMAVRLPVFVITGGPGTGKTTILNQVLKIFERCGVVTVLTAPTGRAAKRMELATGRPAKTIHRLLEYGSEPGEDILEQARFRRDADNPVEADAVIVDESSMVDIFLMDGLLAALESGTRLILTGDADQLPSVGPGNVLKDILASEVIPYTVLRKVFRAGGNIVMNAHKVNQGEEIELFTTGDFVFQPEDSPQTALDTTVDSVTRFIRRGESVEEVQVICPIKKGLIGVYNLNKEIRERLNPRLAGKAELIFGDTVFRVGDKVMQTVNNYSKEWHIKGTSPILTGGTGAFNGDMGVIEEIHSSEKSLIILFDGDRLAEYQTEELTQIEHAYAVTVHKSQGSEFDTVILPLFYGYSDFLTRNLLYTAITRAKKKMIIIGREATVRNMIRNAKISLRYTALDHELKKQEAFLKKLAGEKVGEEDAEAPLLYIFKKEE